ncbi:MAG: YraN family protein [Candidatus Cloacimonetes bacterium]|nr:YraN family protein [Candidatus Cloacimonadota bacterium]
MLDKSTKSLARTGENLAAKYLLNKGYTLKCKNFRSKTGEIDLIMQDNQHLVFIEVKTRRYHSIDAALENINYTKRKRISQTAVQYINQNPKYGKLQTRFDIVVLIYDEYTNTFSIKHLPDAFHPVFE